MQFCLFIGIAEAQGMSIPTQVRASIVTDLSGSATPSITSVVNGFSFGSGSIAPGSEILIIGANLAAESGVATGFPLPHAINGVQVALDGTLLPLQAVDTGSIWALIPLSYAKDQGSLIVTVNGVVSPAYQLNVARFAPGVLTYSDDGTVGGPAETYLYASSGGYIYTTSGEAPTAVEIDPNTAVSRGNVLAILATGLGAVKNPPADGTIPSADANVALPIAVTVGGFPAQVSSARLANAGDPSPFDIMPWTPGTYLIQFTVPDGAPNGSAVPLVVYAGGKPSVAVTINIGGTTPTPIYPAISSIPTQVNPLNSVTIKGSGFDPTSQVMVRFTDGAQFDIRRRAMQITANSLLVTVPPYRTLRGGAYGYGTVSVSVVQTKGGTSTESTAVHGIHIADLPQTLQPTGAITQSILRSLAHGMVANAGILGYKQSAAHGSQSVTRLKSALRAHATAIHRLANAMTPLVSVKTNSVPLGTLGGQVQTLTPETMIVMDRYLAAIFQQDPAVAQQAHLASVAVLRKQDSTGEPQLKGVIVKEASSTTTGVIQTASDVWNVWQEFKQAINGSKGDPAHPTATEAESGIDQSMSEAADRINEILRSRLEPDDDNEKPGGLLGLLISLLVDLRDSLDAATAFPRMVWPNIEAAMDAIVNTENSLASSGAPFTGGGLVTGADSGPLADALQSQSTLQDLSGATGAMIASPINSSTGSGYADYNPPPSHRITGTVQDALGSDCSECWVASSAGGDPDWGDGAVYNDGSYSLSIPAGPGYPSSGNLTVFDGDTTQALAGFDVSNGDSTMYFQGSASSSTTFTIGTSKFSQLFTKTNLHGTFSGPANISCGPNQNVDWNRSSADLTLDKPLSNIALLETCTTSGDGPGNIEFCSFSNVRVNITAANVRVACGGAVTAYTIPKYSTAGYFDAGFLGALLSFSVTSPPASSGVDFYFSASFGRPQGTENSLSIQGTAQLYWPLTTLVPPANVTFTLQ
jgi:uncharacterized protein (TIGR03437 family)